MRLVVMFLVLGVIPPAADAQQSLEPGEPLYQQNCALCHGDTGGGDPPRFPTLRDSDRLSDPGAVVRIIRAGGRRMPPFPALTVEEVASLVNFIRTAWDNGYSRLTRDEVTALEPERTQADSIRSAWDGVFTDAQARRGEAVYAGACGFCHGRRLDGAADDPDMRSSPPLARARFLRVWEGRPLAMLFEYTRATMPEDNPSSLTEQDYVDVIAYMLEVGGMPAGDEELRPDLVSLARIVLRSQP